LNLYQIFGFRFLATNYHSQFQLELLKVKPRTIQVFHYPIGIYESPLLRKEIEIKNNVRLLFCSRMIEQYDPIEAIRQYLEWQRTYPNVSLTMVKYGPLFDYVNDFVKKEGVDVHFADPVAFEDLPEFYSNYDFLLLPARFGNGNAVVMEAGMCGVVPVIRDSTPGAREQIIQGLTGFLYKTEKEFIKTLNLAMTLTSNERVQVQKNAITTFGHRTPRGRAYRLYEIIADNI
jgi:glycosyltransferase involved in cell wall biosynthesis